MLFTLLVAAPASASTLQPDCHAFSPANTTYAELERQKESWTCSSFHWKDVQPVAWLRFDAADWQAGEPPQSFVSRVSHFHRLSLFAVQEDGTLRAVGMQPDELPLLESGPFFAAPLPPITADTQAIVVRIAEPWGAEVLAEAKLSTQPGGEGWPIERLLLFAMLAGLLLVPVIFDIATFAFLRERFVLFHGALTLMMLTYVTTSSGLIVPFADLSLVTIYQTMGISIAVVGAMACFLAAEIIEPGMLSAAMRRALRLAGISVILISGTVPLHPPFMDSSWSFLFELGFAAPIIAYIAALTQALRRGSRAAKYLVVAWAPIITFGIEQSLRGLGIYSAPQVLDDLFYLALSLEVVITAAGVADRLLALTRERDEALKQIRALEELAEHDPLTGLYNRRAIEPQFRQLSASGFTTFGVIDVDYFKSINDDYGHDVGDQVLRAIGKALPSDENALSARIGGEEFLLLLRGPDALRRAEHIRQNLTRQIAQQVPGLDHLVTASMGLVEGTPETMAASSFRQIYAQADKLLYEAKVTGRNRIAAEKLTVFKPRRRDRRSYRDRRMAA